MTMPHLENCRHEDEGWCAKCVKDAGEESLRKDDAIADLTARLAAAEAERDAAIRDTTWQDHADHWQKLALKVDAERDALKALAERAEAAWRRLAEMVRSHDRRAWAPSSMWEALDAAAKDARAAVTAEDLVGPQ